MTETTKVFMTTRNGSLRKVEAFIKQNSIPYEMINIEKEGLSKEDFFSILANTDNGLNDIISTRSHIYTQLTGDGTNFDDYKLSEMFDLICKHPDLIKSPIMVKGKLTVIGYNVETITSLMNRDDKKKMFERTTERARIMGINGEFDNPKYIG